MNVTVIGASGRVGSRLVEYLAEAGHSATAFVRDRSRLPEPFTGERVAVGDVRAPEAVAAAVAGADAVLTALSSEGVHAPGTTLSEGAANVVAAAHRHGVRRVMAVASSGMLDVVGGGLRRDQPDYPEVFRLVSEEHHRVWQTLRESGLDWTLVCPPHLPSGERTGSYRVAADRLPEGGRQISVEDVADFMVRELVEGRFVGTRVGIAY